MKKDKTQGVVFVLPKSKEFFGRIQDGPTKLPTSGTRPTAPIISKRRTHTVSAGVKQAEAQKEINSLKELKMNLSKLSQLHDKLKSMLDELDDIVKD
jgi:hypothetical protein